MYGGADADTISSRGFMARGAKHSEVNDSGKSKGIPFDSQESKMIHSTVITNEGHKAGTKAAKTKDNPNGEASKVPVEKILKAFEAAENNPNDVFRNNKIAMNFMDERLAHQEQRSNEGKFLKGLRDELKKKDPELFARVMEYVVKNNPNDAQQVMEGEGAGMPTPPPAEMPEGMEMPGGMGMEGMMPPMQGEGQPPMMRYGGRKKVKHQYSGATSIPQEMYDRKNIRSNIRDVDALLKGYDLSHPAYLNDDLLNSIDRQMGEELSPDMSGADLFKRGFYPGTTEWYYKQGHSPRSQELDVKLLHNNLDQERKQRGQLPFTRFSRQLGGQTTPDLMTNEQRYNFNMKNNLYQMGGMVPGGMDPMAAQGMMGAPGSGLPPELQAAQGMPMAPEDELAMAQDPSMAGMDQQGGGEQVDTSMAMQIMQSLPNILKPMSPEELAMNPDDIFSEGFEKELQQMGMDMAQIKAINVDELGTGQIGEILGQMLQDASPEGKAPGGMDAGMPPMGGEGEMMPEGMPMEGEVPPEMMQQQAMGEVQQMMAYGGRSDQGFPDFKYQDSIWMDNDWRPTFSLGGRPVNQKFQNRMTKRFGQEAVDNYMTNHQGNMGSRKDMRKSLKHFNPLKSTQRQPVQGYYGSNNIASRNTGMGMGMSQPNSFDPNVPSTFGSYGRMTGQESLKTPGDMDISMAKQRAAEDVSWMPQIGIENIDPATFNSIMPGVQTQPYDGFESKFRRDEFDIPAPQQEEVTPEELDTRPDYDTEGKTYQTLAEEAGLLKSGKSAALHENVANTLKGMFKGTDSPGKPGSKGILTEAGREHFAKKGMTPDQMDALTYENMPTSEAWSKYIGPAMEEAYGGVQNQGDSFQSMNKIRSTNFPNTGAATLALVEEALKNNRILHSDYGADVVEPIMDLLASDEGQGLTLDMVKNNPTKILDLFGKVMSKGTKFGSYKAATDKYGSGVTQSETKEQLQGVTSNTQKGHVPLEVENPDLGKGGKGMSFSQAFRYAKKNEMPTFTWNGRLYLGKTSSETSDEEDAAMKKAKGKYQGPSPTGDSTPGKFPFPGVSPKFTPGSPGANFAKHATGSAVTQQPVAGKPKSYKGGFDYEHTERSLTPLGRDNKATGGRTLSNGQYIEFQYGGRTMRGRVKGYNPSTGDFELE